MRIVALVATLLLVFGAGVYVGYKIEHHQTKPGVMVTQYKTQYLKQPQTTQELKQWYHSPITITARAINTHTIRVKARDECKMAEADIRIDSPTPTRPFILGVTVGVIATILVIVIL